MDRSAWEQRSDSGGREGRALVAKFLSFRGWWGPRGFGDVRLSYKNNSDLGLSSCFEHMLLILLQLSDCRSKSVTGKASAGQ